MADAYFGPGLFQFLTLLRQNNDRAWFAANKERYEREVRDPMLQFITDAAVPLARVSRQILADPRPVGGSLFRIYRDTRFSKDKTPYKTHVAAHFRHRAGKDVHAPGFYFHLEPGRVLLGTGIWHPDPPALLKIRGALAKNPAGWKRVIGSAPFRRMCTLEGDAVRRPPRGFAPDHPLIEDIKRKDFTAMTILPEAEALKPTLMKKFEAFCRTTAPLNAFLAKALGLNW